MHPVNLCLPLNLLLQLGHTSKLFYEASVEEKRLKKDMKNITFWPESGVSTSKGL